MRKKVTEKEWKGEAQRFFVFPFCFVLVWRGTLFINNRSTLYPKTHKQNADRKTLNCITKGSQNGTQNDAQTHHNSMPKFVTEKIMNIIKNHVSLNGIIIQIHCKNKCECLSG